MTPLLYIKFGVIAFAIVGAGYLGYSYEHNRFMVFKKEVDALAREQEQKVISVQKQQNLVTKGVVNEFQAKLGTVRNYYGGLQHSASSGKLPTLSNPAGRANESAAYYELAGACAETTVQTLALQQWIKEQAGIQ